MTTILRWPLRFGCLAILTVEIESEDRPGIDSRQAHLVGCPCARCRAIVTAKELP